MKNGVTLDISDLRFLIVDDQPPVRRILCNILAELGVRKIDEASDGKDALERISGPKPDIIIADSIMEPMDRVEFVKRFRSGDTGVDPYVPIIMISGKTGKENIFMARDSGIDEFLAKPFSAKLVLQRLCCIINQPRAYVRGKDFFGPDRRRRELTTSQERRTEPYFYTAPLRETER